MKRIIALLRHGKAEEKQIHQRDFDRRLIQKGKSNTHKVGEKLSALKFAPNLILCSESKRTKQTLEELFKRWQSDAPIIYNANLYLASIDQLWSTIDLNTNHKKILIVGHNEGLSELATYLNSKQPVHLKTSHCIIFEEQEHQRYQQLHYITP